jgi:hypothetical protein
MQSRGGPGAYAFALPQDRPVSNPHHTSGACSARRPAARPSALVHQHVRRAPHRSVPGGGQARRRPNARDLQWPGLRSGAVPPASPVRLRRHARGVTPAGYPARAPGGAYSRTGGHVLPAAAAAVVVVAAVVAAVTVAAVAVAARAGVPLVTAASRAPAGPGLRHPFRAWLSQPAHSIVHAGTTMSFPGPRPRAAGRGRPGGGRPRGGGGAAGARGAGGPGPAPPRPAGRTGMRPGQHPSRVPAILAASAVTPAIKAILIGDGRIRGKFCQAAAGWPAWVVVLWLGRAGGCGLCRGLLMRPFGCGWVPWGGKVAAGCP